MRYIINQKYFSFKDKFNIFDDRDHPVYQVNSKWISVPKTFTLCMSDGRPIVTIKKKIRLGLCKFQVFTNQNSGSELLMTIQRKIKPFGCKVAIDSNCPQFGSCTLTGNILAWNFTLLRDSDNALLATISKKWLRIADTYAVDVADVVKKYDYLVLAIAIAVDFMFHREH